MIKAESLNGFNYLPLGGKKLPVICFRNKTFLYHQDGMEKIINETGQLVLERKLDKLYEDFYGSNSCHRPDIFLRNKRGCNPCTLMGVCCCHHNEEGKKFREAVELLKNPIENT